MVDTSYSSVGVALRRLYRTLRPIAPSTLYGPDDDICSVRLVPDEALTRAFRRAIRKLALNGRDAAYVEFGVFNGTSLSCMARAATFEGAQIRLIGLDSFEGLPPNVGGEDGGVWLPGQFACSRERAQECLARAGIRFDAVEFVSKWYDDVTTVDLQQALGGASAAIVMVDCDAYSSARRALELITPFLASTTIVFFDDWRLRNVDLLGGGEYRAFNEWRESWPNWRVDRFVSYNRKSEAFVVTAL